MKYAYGIVPSIFGKMLVAFSSKGVAALYPAYDKGSEWDNIWNNSYIERIWSGHELVEGGASERRSAKEIIKMFVNNPAPDYKSCELDPPYGFEFQREVWNELRNIPLVGPEATEQSLRLSAEIKLIERLEPLVGLTHSLSSSLAIAS